MLVGHSLGGLLVRLYAGSYPREVAGLISVDAVHEILYEAYRALLPPDQLALFAAPGQIDVVASAAVVRRARLERPLRPMPLVVLPHSPERPLEYPPGNPVEALERAFRAGQDDLATLESRAQHLVATRSAH